MDIAQTSVVMQCSQSSVKTLCAGFGKITQASRRTPNMMDAFEQKVKATLNNTANDLDAITRKRLADIRSQVLMAKTTPTNIVQTSAAQSKQLNFWFNFKCWAPVSSLAICSLLVVYLAFYPNLTKNNNSETQIQNDQIAALELLDSEDGLEVLTDPDFYAWMAEKLAQEAKIAS